MSEKHRIAVVDDTAPQRLILSRLLANEHEVVEFANGEAFLAADPTVDVILLDIEMPGLSGYETCRRLRALENHHETPVIFVSAHDTAPERVAAYEAGGDDFVTKPIVASELHHKVTTLLSQKIALEELHSRSASVQQMAFSLMSNMGELGAIIEFMRQSVLCTGYDQIADQVVNAMKSWGLRGLVQVRSNDGAIDRSTDEVVSPLQQSVIATMRNMGRIFELKSRAVVNYDRISILVQNLPTDNPDQVGRLRDHLALLGELADNSLNNFTTKTELSDLGAAITQLQETMQQTAVRDIENRQKIQKQALDILDSVERTFVGMGVTSVQRDYVTNLIGDGMDELNHAFEEANAIQHDFAEALLQLQKLSDTHASDGKAK